MSLSKFRSTELLLLISGSTAHARRRFDRTSVALTVHERASSAFGGCWRVAQFLTANKRTPSATLRFASFRQDRATPANRRGHWKGEWIQQCVLVSHPVISGFDFRYETWQWYIHNGGRSCNGVYSPSTTVLLFADVFQQRHIRADVRQRRRAALLFLYYLRHALAHAPSFARRIPAGRHQPLPWRDQPVPGDASHFEQVEWKTLISLFWPVWCFSQGRGLWENAFLLAIFLFTNYIMHLNKERVHWYE